MSSSSDGGEAAVSSDGVRGSSRAIHAGEQPPQQRDPPHQLRPQDHGYVEGYVVFLLNDMVDIDNIAENDALVQSLWQTREWYAIVKNSEGICRRTAISMFNNNVYYIQTCLNLCVIQVTIIKNYETFHSDMKSIFTWLEKYRMELVPSDHARKNICWQVEVATTDSDATELQPYGFVLTSEVPSYICSVGRMDVPQYIYRRTEDNSASCSE